MSFSSRAGDAIKFEKIAITSASKNRSYSYSFMTTTDLEAPQRKVTVKSYCEGEVNDCFSTIGQFRILTAGLNLA